MERVNLGRPHRKGSPWWFVQLMLPAELAERLRERWLKETEGKIKWREWLISLLGKP
jgi:hypothetical protein